MGRQPKRCPCSVCKGDSIKYEHWTRHSQQLSAGTRVRWDGDGNDESKDVAYVDAAQPEANAAVDEAAQERAARAFTFEIVDLVARNQLNVQGAEAALQAISKHHQQLLPAGCVIPKTM